MMKRHTFVYARLQGNRVLTRSYEHLVGAYGVVGFSGVKDARRASYSPTLQRRPAHHARIRRSMDKPWTNPGQTLCECDYRKTACPQQEDSISRAKGQQIDSNRHVGRQSSELKGNDGDGTNDPAPS